MRFTKTIFTVLLIIQSGILSAQLSNGLIVNYSFNNGSADDESGNGNNGIEHNTTLGTDRFGNPNKSFVFNGTSSYVEMPDSLLQK